MQVTRALSSLGLALLLASCADAPVPTISPPPEEGPSMNTVARISICCGGTFQVGQSATISATAYDQNNNVLPYATIWFSSSNSSIASVATAGNPVRVDMLSSGNTAIWATSGTVSASVPISVVAPPVVTTVTVSPSPVSMTVGYTRQLTARAYDQWGNQMWGVSATWTSLDPSVASVSSTGSLTGMTVGSTTVRATINGVSATVPVTVTNQLTVTIDGPYVVGTAGQYTWTAHALGGAGNYTYKWIFESGNPWGPPVQVGTGASHSMWVDSSVSNQFTLHVEVTSGTQTATAQIGVCNFTVSAMC